MEWPPPKHRWPAGLTANTRGWIRYYRGKTRYVAARSVPLAELEDVWIEVKKRIDAELNCEPAPIDASRIGYREALSEFLSAMRTRVETGKPRPLKARTFWNYQDILNRFGSFMFHGSAIADMPLAEVNSPAVLGAFSATFGSWKSSGYDSIVARVGTFFAWAVEMEYIDRFRPGPQFKRPAKSEIRDQRIELVKSFTPQQVARMLAAANQTMRCWIMLGVCGAMNNSDIAHLTPGVVDLHTGIIDYRRRKTGRVRRIIPLPDDVRDALRAYRDRVVGRDSAATSFFITERKGAAFAADDSLIDFSPSDTISRLFRRVCEDAGVTRSRGQGFSGLRTTFFNLCPVGYDAERSAIMGRAKGSIDLDHYAEGLNLDRLRHVVNHVWSQISSERTGQAASPSASPVAEAAPSSPTAPPPEPAAPAQRLSSEPG